MEAVGSSAKIKGGFFEIIFAKAIRWDSPPDPSKMYFSNLFFLSTPLTARIYRLYSEMK